MLKLSFLSIKHIIYCQLPLVLLLLVLTFDDKGPGLCAGFPYPDLSRMDSRFFQMFRMAVSLTSYFLASDLSLGGFVLLSLEIISQHCDSLRRFRLVSAEDDILCSSVLQRVKTAPHLFEPRVPAPFNLV
jgi:hypothetical protein